MRFHRVSRISFITNRVYSLTMAVVQKQNEIKCSIKCYRLVLSHSCVLQPLKRCLFDRQKTLAEIDQLTEHLDGREKTVVGSYCRGRALNVKDVFSEEAVDLLSKAVKLNPKLTNAWVELGHCYWKKGEAESAMHCFQSALNLDPKHAECLKSLSIVLRSFRSEKDRFENLQRSLKLAKEAVEVDMTDGSCWTILGNAFLTMYCFSPTQVKYILLFG